MADDFRSLGEELRDDFREWLGGVLDGWIAPETVETAEALDELGRLEDAVAALAADQADLGRMQAWLTAGFDADAPPVSILAAAPEPEEDEPARRSAAADFGGGSPEPRRAAVPFSGDAWSGTAADGWSAFDLPTARSESPERPGDADAGRSRAWDAIQGEPRRTSFALPTADQPGDRDRWGDALSRSPEADRPGALDVDLPRDVPAARGAGAIGGLAGLAALAGSRGLDLPEPVTSAERSDRRDADRPAQPAGPASARSWPEPPATAPTAERWPDAQPEPIRRRAWPEVESAGRSDADASPSPPTPTDQPNAAREWERMLAAASTATAFPFERMPGEMEEDADVAAPGFPAPPASAGSMSAPDRTVTARGWSGEDAMAAPFPTDADERLIASAGRLAGPRLRPAAEILGALAAAPAASAPAAATTPASAPEWTAVQIPVAPAEPATARERVAAEQQPVIVRAAALPASDDPVEPPSWPDADVSDVLDALAREIMHEYRRYYGE